LANTSVSNRPIWLADAALASTARLPKICRVIEIKISRQSTENQLAQKHNQRMQPVLASSRISQQSVSNVVQAAGT